MENYSNGNYFFFFHNIQMQPLSVPHEIKTSAFDCSISCYYIMFLKLKVQNIEFEFITDLSKVYITFIRN